MIKPSTILTAWVRAFRTVGSAMLGVRASERHEEDFAAVSPLVLVVVAVAVAALFFGGLVALAIFIAKA